MKILGIIPSRYASSRFPGKPLAMILGKTMIQRVYEQAEKASSLSKLLVATDDERIFQHVQSFDGSAVMTSPHHLNGTERCAEAMHLSGEIFDAVINIQGDEPFIHHAQIDLVANCLMKSHAKIATLIKKIVKSEEYQNPSVVKVVLNKNSEALYFSRSPIPHARQDGVEENLNAGCFFKHIGIYGFRTDVLREIIKLPPSKLETIEMLEQLRWLENGYPITTCETEYDTHAVDTPEDIQKLIAKN